MKWLENITGGYSSSAKVVGDTLVLSLPDARSPVVWRMELGEIKAAAFEIEHNDKDGFVLVMKNPKGESQNIAPFDNKARAVKALMATSQAMEHAQSATKGAAANVNTAQVHSSSDGKSNLLAGLVGVVVLGVLIFALTQMGPPNNFPGQTAAQGGSASVQGTGDARGSAGVPMSADDFLRAK